LRLPEVPREGELPPNLYGDCYNTEAGSATPFFGNPHPLCRDVPPERLYD